MFTPSEAIAFHGELEPGKPAIIAGDSIVSYGMLRMVVEALAARVAALDLPQGGLVATALAAPGRFIALSLALERCGLNGAGFSSPAMLAALPPTSAILTDRPFTSEGGQVATVIGDSWFGPATGAPSASGRGSGGRTFVAQAGGGLRSLTLPLEEVTARVAEQSIVNDLVGPSRRVLSLLGTTSPVGYLSAVAALSEGKTVYFPMPGQDPMQLALAHGCDVIQCSTQQVAAIAERQVQRFVLAFPLSALRVEGVTITEAALRKAQSFICGRIVRTFGIPQIPTASMELIDSRPFAGGSIGTPAPWIETQIVGADGQPVQRGAAGILHLREKKAGSRWVETDIQASFSGDGRLVVKETAGQAEEPRQ